VTHCADAGYAVKQLEMSEAVPGERSDPVPGPNSKRRKSFGEASAARPGISITVPVALAFGHAAHDLRLAVKTLGVLDYGGKQEWPIHHHAEHRLLQHGGARGIRATFGWCTC